MAASGQIVQRAERSAQRANRNLPLLQFCGDVRGGAAAERQGRMLREGPGTEGAAIVFSIGKQRGVDAHAVTAGGGVQRDVDGGVIGVGEDGALVEREVGVGIAQHQSRDAAALQFLAQAAGQGDGDVFLQQRSAESFSEVIAAVAGVDDGKVTAVDLGAGVGRRRWLAGAVTGAGRSSRGRQELRSVRPRQPRKRERW